MSMSINNNDQLIITQLGDGVSWQPDTSQTVDGGNYGEVLSVSTNTDGSYVVTTNKGTLTFSANSPELESAKETFADYELSSTGLEKFTGFNWLEIAALVLQAENLRRKTSREVRLAARDTAFNQNMAAADDIKKGALANLIGGCISGGLSIAGGVFSLKGALSSIKSARMSSQEVSVSKTESEMASTQAELSSVKSEIAAKQANLEDPNFAGDKVQVQKDLDTLEARETQLETEVQQQRSQLDQDLQKTEAKLEKTQKELDETNEKLNEYDKKINDPETSAAKRQYYKFRRQLALNTRENLTTRQELLTARQEHLTEIKATSDSFQTDINGSKAAEAKQWATEANDRYNAAQAQNLQDYQKVQAELQVAQSVNGMLQGIGQIATTLGGYIDSQYQAASKIEDAKAEQSKYAQDDANQDLQNANDAIRKFTEAWQKFLDTIKATQDRLVQA
ncbi:hypothetical protein GC197_08850 [bacterium]|nr:hypothetical protein [bacterium]